MRACVCAYVSLSVCDRAGVCCCLCCAPPFSFLPSGDGLAGPVDLLRVHGGACRGPRHADPLLLLLLHATKVRLDFEADKRSHSVSREQDCCATAYDPHRHKGGDRSAKAEAVNGACLVLQFCPPHQKPRYQKKDVDWAFNFWFPHFSFFHQDLSPWSHETRRRKNTPQEGKI